jgi:hypothetical protein
MENGLSNISSIDACAFFAMGTYLPSFCLATAGGIH